MIYYDIGQGLRLSCHLFKEIKKIIFQRFFFQKLVFQIWTIYEKNSPQSSAPSQIHWEFMHKLILEQENSPGGQDDLVQFFSSLPSEQSRSPSHFQRLWIQNGGDSHWNWFSRSQSVVQKSSSVVSSQSGIPSQNLDSWIHFPSEQVTSDSEQLRYWSKQSISSELSPKKKFQIFNIIAAATIQILNSKRGYYFNFEKNCNLPQSSS